MSGSQLVVALCFLGTTLLLLVFAYLIGCRGMTGLISGYERGTAGDEEGLARFVATRLTMLAVFYLIMGTAFLFVSTPIGIVLLIFVTVIGTSGSVILLTFGQSKFTDRASQTDRS